MLRWISESAKSMRYVFRCLSCHGRMTCANNVNHSWWAAWLFPSARCSQFPRSITQSNLRSMRKKPRTLVFRFIPYQTVPMMTLRKSYRDSIDGLKSKAVRDWQEAGPLNGPSRRGVAFIESSRSVILKAITPSISGLSSKESCSRPVSSWTRLPKNLIFPMGHGPLLRMICPGIPTNVDIQRARWPHLVKMSYLPWASKHKVGYRAMKGLDALCVSLNIIA